MSPTSTSIQSAPTNSRIRALTITCSLAAATFAVTLPATRSMAAPPAAASTPAVLEEPLEGGTHWRIQTAHGPVHIWRPAGYNYATAGIVVYVHGYRTSIDRAWTEHHLAAQFALSKQNALFIAPEAPSGMRDGVAWPSMSRLLREVRRKTRLARPWGHIVAIGHSGGYRTILRWLDYRHLDHVILLDGLYGHEEPFRDWTRQTRFGSHKLILVGADTLRWTEPFARRYRTAPVFDLIPETLEEIEPANRRGRLLYMRSQYDHMGMITGGKTIPLLLRLTRLKLVTSAEPTVSR